MVVEFYYHVLTFLSYESLYKLVPGLLQGRGNINNGGWLRDPGPASQESLGCYRVSFSENSTNSTLDLIIFSESSSR